MQQVELDMYATGIEVRRISKVKCHAMHMTDQVRTVVIQKASRSGMNLITFETSYTLGLYSQDMGDQQITSTL